MLLDIGVGILAALGLAELLQVPITTSWIGAGIFFALLPDLDALVNYVQYRSFRMAYKHRDLLHLPIVYVLLAVLIYFFSPTLALLCIVCTLAHFIHDSIGVGWGVQWLWPLNTDHFSFLYLYQPEGKPLLPRQLFYRWKHIDIDALDAKHGDPNWIHNIYVRGHPYGLVELAVFFVALWQLFVK